ncbi:MAG TPA: glycosyltransferase family 39 protein [Gaiellaceae bacterium]|nr:glycosyltransferase family 39 protein [Gaiellaceae bacterium]
MPVLVGSSTLLHWLAGRRLHGLWIVPDEAIYADRAFVIWRHGPLPLLHGGNAGYGLLYPLLAGLPLSTGSISAGYASLKLLQALVVSLAAVPVFLYAQRVMPRRHALLAAALTVCSPLLLYSGLVMTEVLFYPLAAVALLAVAHAVATATIRGQAVALLLIFLAILTRAQALVFLVIFVAAILLDAALARDRARIRAFWPTWSVVLVAGTALVVFPQLVGAYGETLRGGYPLRRALTLAFDHLSYIALSTGVVPVAALLVCLVGAMRGREPNPLTRALIAVTTCSVIVLPLQVGLFAARYSPTLLGRDLAPLPPLLFTIFALWVSRGATQRLTIRVLCAFAVLCILLLAPWNSLVTPDAFADTLDLTVFTRLRSVSPADIVAVFALPMLCGFVFLRGRAVLALPLLVAAVLAFASFAGAQDLKVAVNNGQAAVVGPTPDWIDRAVDGDVTYLYGGEPSWNTVWQERFWNRRIDRVLALSPNRVPGPLEQTSVTVRANGRLRSPDPYVVAPDPLTFFGTRVAHLTQTNLDVSGLTLWRVTRPLRLSTVTKGVQANGDMSQPAVVTVYDCTGGRLELTLLPKETDVLRILLDGRLVLRARIRGLGSWHGSLRVPRSARPRICTFTIEPDPLLGSTVINFVRA